MTTRTFTVTVRKCATEQSRFRYVITPAPDGSDEFVSPRYFKRGRGAYRAGLRHAFEVICETYRNSLKPGALEKMTYGELVTGTANAMRVMLRRWQAAEPNPK